MPRREMSYYSSTIKVVVVFNQKVIIYSFYPSISCLSLKYHSLFTSRTKIFVHGFTVTLFPRASQLFASVRTCKITMLLGTYQLESNCQNDCLDLCILKKYNRSARRLLYRLRQSFQFTQF